MLAALAEESAVRVVTGNNIMVRNGILDPPGGKRV